MAKKQEVPGPARENNERLRSRPYESDFARFPEEEIDKIDRPGGGPHGSLSSGERNLPLVVIAIGALIAFTAFGADSAVPLVIGLVVVIAGAIWAGLRGRTVASGEGLGTSTIEAGEQ